MQVCSEKLCNKMETQNFKHLNRELIYVTWNP